MSTIKLYVSRIGQTFKNTISAHRTLIDYIIYASLGFLTSQAVVFGTLSPFAVSFFAASKYGRGYAVLLGALIGYILPLNPASSLKYIYALIIIAIIKFVIKTVKLRSDRTYIPPLMTFISIMLSAFTLVAAHNITLQLLFTTVAEALLATATAYFFHKSEKIIANVGFKGAIAYDTMSMGICAGIILISACAFRIYDWNIGHILAVIAVLIFADSKGITGGTIAGLLAGTCLTLNAPSMSILCGIYGICGLTAGSFKRSGKLAIAVSYLVMNAVLTLFAMTQAGTIDLLYETIFASTIYMLIPSWLIAKLGLTSHIKLSEENIGGLKKAVTIKLGFAGKALSDVSDSVTEVSQRLAKINKNDLSSLYSEVCENICKNCSLRNKCWSTHYSDTMTNWRNIYAVLRKDGLLTPQTAPDSFTRSCCNAGEIINKINLTFTDLSQKARSQNRIAEIRNVVTEQYHALSKTLEEFSDNILDTKSIDNDLANKVTKYFTKCSVTPLAVSASNDIYARTTVDICLDSSKVHAVNTQKLASDLSELCNKNFDLPGKSTAGNIIKLTLFEKVCYDIDFFAIQQPYKDNKLCGDSYTFFLDGSGRAYIIISDGMGHGNFAAVDGTMTTSLMSKLLKAGWGLDSSLKIVNSAMLIKSGDETLATIDGIKIDLYSGKCDFFKAGAAPTYYRHNKKTAKFEVSSLPIGILSNIEFANHTEYLIGGDVLVMVSDGVVSENDDWLISALDSYNGESAKAFAKRIYDRAKVRNINQPDDDMTVAVAVIHRG